VKTKLFVLMCCTTVWGGCNVALHGSWKTVEVIPGEAAKDFKIATATFNADDTFTCVSQYGKERKMDKGKYFFDGFRLKLTTDKGKELTYNCMKVWDKLEVTKVHEGKKVKIVMAQQ